jgi:soluble lytic murein transglycosylase-like protein
MAMTAVLAIASPWSGQAQARPVVKPRQEIAECLRAAAHRYGVNPTLLKAIAWVESGFNPGALNLGNADGSRDIGLMQINSRWLPTLRRWAITERAIEDPCVNAQVGAWILAENFARLGVTWEAVGAYNTASAHKRRAYAWKVYQAYRVLAQTGASDGMALVAARPAASPIAASSLYQPGGPNE